MSKGSTNKILEVSYLLLDNGYHCISGKIFDNKNKEIKYREFLKQIAYSYHMLVEDAKKVIEQLLCFGEVGKWHELPIVEEAKSLGAIWNDLAMPFPLDYKQLQIINIMLFHPEEEVLFICTGVGGSGKSTFLNIVKQLFDNDFSSASLSDLANEFSVAEAVKSRLICSDELAKGDLDSKVLKQLASKQTMLVNPKGKTAYEVKTQSSLFWCCNNVPKIDCTDTGILRRLIYYCRDTPIKNPDKSLNGKEYSHDQLLIIARRALAFEDKKWRQLFEKETHKCIMSNNSVAICNTSDYSQYKDKCLRKGLKPFSEPNFEQILELFKEWKGDAEVKIEDDDLPF